MLIKRIAALWKRLTNAGRLLVFIPACFFLLCCWAVAMLALAVFYIGEGRIMALIKKLDKFLVKDVK